MNYAHSLMRLGRMDEAKSALDAAEAVPVTSKWLRLRILGTRGLLASRDGDIETAGRVFEQMRKEHRAAGNVSDERIAAGNLAEIEHARGNTQLAIAAIQDLLPGLRSDADRAMHMSQLTNLTGYLVAVDELVESRRIGREALRVLGARDPEAPLAGMTIEHLALACALEGNLPRAALLEGYADAVFRKYGFIREITERITYDRLSRLLEEGLPPDERARLLAEGAALAPDAAISLALDDA
jgi:tetratricopeptide (TPR) repeat protein